MTPPTHTHTHHLYTHTLAHPKSGLFLTVQDEHSLKTKDITTLALMVFCVLGSKTAHNRTVGENLATLQADSTTKTPAQHIVAEVRHSPEPASPPHSTLDDYPRHTRFVRERPVSPHTVVRQILNIDLKDYTLEELLDFEVALDSAKESVRDEYTRRKQDRLVQLKNRSVG